VTLGKLGEEVAAYRQDCAMKASQAQELAENMQQDCIDLLRQLIDTQEDQFFGQKMEGRILISNLHEMDQQVKQRAVAYFHAARDAEEAVGFYEEHAKFSIELKLTQKQAAFEAMIAQLKKAKERETQYKEIIDNANTYLVEFTS
jgi:hypothetical protein